MHVYLLTVADPGRGHVTDAARNREDSPVRGLVIVRPEERTLFRQHRSRSKRGARRCRPLTPTRRRTRRRDRPLLPDRVSGSRCAHDHPRTRTFSILKVGARQPIFVTSRRPRSCRRALVAGHRSGRRGRSLLARSEGEHVSGALATTRLCASVIEGRRFRAEPRSDRPKLGRTDSHRKEWCLSHLTRKKIRGVPWPRGCPARALGNLLGNYDVMDHQLNHKESGLGLSGQIARPLHVKHLPESVTPQRFR